MMNSRKTRGWIVFVISCLFISLLGFFFLLFYKKIFIPGFVNDSGHDIIVNGWAIVVVGIATLLFGLVIRWSLKNDKSDSTGDIDPPRTELIDRKQQTI